MTTLAAIELEDGSILIGSDSMAGSSHRISAEVDHLEPVEKWVEWPHGWWVGLAGFYAMIQTLRNAEDVELSDDVESVISAIRKIFDAQGDQAQYNDDGMRRYNHSDLIVARAGTGVFNVDRLLGHFKIKRFRPLFEGSGRDFAYGAFRLAASTQSVSIAFHEALAVATELDDGCGPPIIMKELLVGEEAQDLNPPPRIADLAPKDHPMLTNGSDLPQRTIKPAHVRRTGITVEEFDAAAKACKAAAGESNLEDYGEQFHRELAELADQE